MALLGNYSVLHKSPGKFLSGTIASGDRANWNKPGMMRSMGAGSGNDWTLAAIPQGFGAGGAWMLPKTAGGMTSRRLARLIIDGLGSGALGRNMIAAGIFTIDGTALGGLIAGGIGNAVITIEANGAIVATIAGEGSALITIGAVADPGALGWLVGNGPITIDGNLIAYAIGWMVGTTAEGGLTPAGIANAVWNAIAASLNASGTMGEKMNAAGAAGDPWLTELPGAYAEGSAGDIIGNQIPAIKTLAEFLSHIEGGKWKIEANQMIFYKSDNVTEVARFNLYNAAGVPSMTEVYERRRI